jgi:4'-phosphopantetheinyl transferase
MSTACPATQGVFRLELQRAGHSISAWLAFVSRSEFERLTATAEDFLSEQELAYFRERNFPRRQQSYLLGRYAAKLALAQCLPETGLNHIDIYPGVFGQPLVRHVSAETPGVSLSHCADLAVAIAFPTGHPMAVDVESVDPARVKAMKSQLTSMEREWAGAVPAAEARECALIWTAREALSKVLLCGLTTPAETLAVAHRTLQPQGHWESTYANFAQYQCHSWATDHHALSIVLPKNTTLCLTVDLYSVLESFSGPRT